MTGQVCAAAGSDAEPANDQEFVVDLGEWRVADGQTYPATEAIRATVGGGLTMVIDVAPAQA